MSRPLALSDEDILAVQKSYRRNHYRGAVKDLADRFHVTRPTILKALRVTVKEQVSEQQKQASKNECLCTEATDGLFSKCGHPVTCVCKLCQHHSDGLACLIGGARYRLSVTPEGVKAFPLEVVEVG